jgi:UDP-3-O-[3-hydroxymyristoyl] N-acetylglucosamine deacetylase
MRFFRQTVSKAGVQFEGFGLHSGEPVKVRLEPNDQGLRFFFGNETTLALPENIQDTNRCTRLGRISTVEHLMAALAGLEITDVDVVVTAPELPALDGSSRAYIQGIGEANQIGEEELPTLFSRIFLHEGDAKLAVSAGQGEWRYEFSAPDRWPKFQAYESLDVRSEFAEEIAPARTFGFTSELPQIQAAGLAKGLDLEKALLIGEQGYANVPRFENEPARHKLLDAIGDLYLSGIPIRFLNVVAERTGHRMNVLAAKRLREAVFGQTT